MKRWSIIVIGAISFILATGRIIFSTSDKLDNEMQSYVNKLNYSFTANVDSIVVVNEKKRVGFLLCKRISGKCNPNVEDSLNHHLTNYKRIRFLHFDQDGRFRIFLGRIGGYRPMDSVVVNSDLDRLGIFRDGELLLESLVSRSTTHKVGFAFWLED